MIDGLEKFLLERREKLIRDISYNKGNIAQYQEKIPKMEEESIVFEKELSDVENLLENLNKQNV